MRKEISAEIIADSKNQFGNRITTFVLTFPRHILAELNTHRMFSRNSASSRAVPFAKMLERVESDPFIPIAWMKDHKGMQGTQFFEDQVETEYCEEKWLQARDAAIKSAIELSVVNEDSNTNESEGVTKQFCNRLLEPFMWHTAIVTATEYENFFHLRCPQYKVREDLDQSYRSRKDYIEAYGSEELGQVDDLFWHKRNAGAGEIHIMRLAECMWDAMNESTPKELRTGEWHIPFGDNLLISKISDVIHKAPYKPELIGKERMRVLHREAEDAKIKIATARCARVSYINYEGKDDYEADIKLYERLSSMGHWSPFEHCAQATGDSGWSGNFQGFIQLRKTFIGENKV